ncbi:MAG TPA: (deoxy)nucleoside triphosphate pyrophosphohydrolase [Gemmatimonadaceae bacterium]|nr:(deoxy)nucleoside triphosphate pyrophosphohydrolase [Gemmatimonadaceae bacterium]
MPTESTAPAAAVIRVLAAVIARGDRYLVCQRPADKRHGGLWEFPGGKLEPGETDAEAARRELREELGVEVTEVGRERFGVHDPGSPFHIAFLPVTIVGEPACLEHSALAWATPAELLAYALAPSDRLFVESMLSGGPGATAGTSA